MVIWMWIPTSCPLAHEASVLLRVDDYRKIDQPQLLSDLVMVRTFINRFIQEGYKWDTNGMIRHLFETIIFHNPHAAQALAQLTGRLQGDVQQKYIEVRRLKWRGCHLGFLGRKTIRKGRQIISFLSIQRFLQSPNL